MIKRTLILVHRWLGVALCALFLIWFPSGIGMMYWTFPTVEPGDRLERSPALDPATIVLSPIEAAERIGIRPAPTQTRLNTFDGRPVYRFGGGARPRIVYADTGEEQVEASSVQRDRIAAAWTGQQSSVAWIEPVTSVDQWTVQAPLRTLRPMYRYSWPNGEELYIAGETGEVVQYTTRSMRRAAYVSAIPHWFYFTPLRERQSLWLEFTIWTALIGTVGAILGLVIGAWIYSPRRAYRYHGAPSRLPYRGQKRWHAILGLVFGIAAVTWAFSGMMSLDPFPGVFERLQPPHADHRDLGRELSESLRGTVEMSDFAAAHPRDVVAANPGLGIRELEFASFDGEPHYAANFGRAGTRLLALDGTVIDRFEPDRITAIVRGVAADPAAVEARLIDRYDLYYLDRRRERPLPVLLARLNDDQRTRFYIDPRTGRLVGTYSNRNWVGRWLYRGLHSLDFPWLYDNRPLWDIVVITFMLGGTGLSLTGAVLAWRVLGRTLARIAPPSRGDRAPESILTNESSSRSRRGGSSW
jgi:hypothetical protein